MTNLKLAGSRFTKVSAERNPGFNGKLEIKTNVNIVSLEKHKVTKDTLELTYVFDVDYSNLGKVKIEGILYISGDTKTTKDLLKTYKDKKFDTPEFIGLTNLIMQKSSIKAFELEEELGLPLHIKLPNISFKK
jgi:hypothetical protein